MESLYEKYHLKPVINASGKMTILGVSKYTDEAIKAQQFGGNNFFEMRELEKNVGTYLAQLIGSEDAHIVSSASAGIALSVAAVIGKGDKYHVHHPYSDRFKNREVIIPKGHNVDYGAPVETMIQLGGGKVIEAGYANQCTKESIAEAITENTVAILYIKSHHAVQKDMLSVKEAAEVAKNQKLPFIVDAAAEQDLHTYIDQGADLVIYSGAKAFEGPSSGLVIGRKKYIDWVRLQNKGIGRAMKIGKENILGLAAAVEQYLKVGPETGASIKKRLIPFIEGVNNIPSIKAKMVQDSAGRDIYRAQVSFKEDTKLSAEEVVEELENGTPAIYTRNYQLNKGIIEFDVRSVDEEELERIVERLESILGS